MLVYVRGILQQDRGELSEPRRDGVRYAKVAGQPTLEKVTFLERLQDEYVVVEVDEALAEPWDPVQIQLYGMRTEGRKILLGDIILVPHDVKLGMLSVQPLGEMPPGDEMDCVHPRRELLDAAEPVSQKLPVAVADIAVVGRYHLSGVRAA